MISKVKRLLKATAKKAIRLSIVFTRDVLWNTIAQFQQPAAQPCIIDKRENKGSTPVNTYWEDHTVFTPTFKNVWQSKAYIKQRFKKYPMWKEIMGLYGDHYNEIILDYGCGPGHDLIGFALRSRARKIIGIDISEKALRLAAHRMSLHNIDLDRIDLILIQDSMLTIPLEDQSVDYVYCEGVLHHTSNPEALLCEFYRIMKDGLSLSPKTGQCNKVDFDLP
ncbi:MAG: class I SAM-dependent methyltransferase [Candidatus Aminicenantaceae bacterium]